MSTRKFQHRDQEFEVQARREGVQLHAVIDGSASNWMITRVGGGEFVIIPADGNGPASRVFTVRDGATWWVHLDGRTYRLDAVLDAGSGGGPAGGLTAPIPATVVEVLVQTGDPVAADDVLLVLSAMKMQLEIRAPHAGTVANLSLQAGDQVDGGQQLLTISEPDSDS